jgi:hypothetical protein
MPPFSLSKRLQLRFIQTAVQGGLQSNLVKKTKSKHDLTISSIVDTETIAL